MWDVDDFSDYDTVLESAQPMSQLYRALIISALSVFQDRGNWFDMDDLTWDALAAVLADVVDRVSNGW